MPVRPPAPAYADSSFLVSLYTPNANSPQAQEYLAGRAMEIGAEIFLTFDAGQEKLARAARLKVKARY